MRKTVAFDLDGTLIGTDCAESWLAFLEAKDIPGATLAKARCNSIMEDYQKGTMDMPSYMTAWVQPITDYKITDIDAWVNEFVTRVIRPSIFEQGRKVLQQHLQQDEVLLVSASPDFIVQAIAKELNITCARGIKIASEDAYYSSEIIQPMPFKQGKVIAVNHWLSKLVQADNAQLDIAYSDSINDLPLLQMASVAYCIDPDPQLRSTALANNWQTLRWS